MTTTTATRRACIVPRGFLDRTSNDATLRVEPSAVELTAAVAFKHRGIETRLVLPGLAQQDRSSRCDPALIKAIARGRAWFAFSISGCSVPARRA
jgi:hypothetical protein